MFFGYEANAAYNHGNLDIGASSGGVVTFMTAKLQHLIHAQGSVL